MSMHRIGHVLNVNPNHPLSTVETIKTVRIIGITTIDNSPAYECEILKGFDARNKKTNRTTLRMTWIDRYYNRVRDDA